MYSFRSRIRFSECGAKGELTVTSLLDYFQDCSTFQSEDLGIGIKPLRKRGALWVVNSWQIDILRFPELGEEVETGTIPYDIKGFFGKRNFYMKDALGNYLAKADSLWTYISAEAGMPERIPDDILNGYRMESKLDMEYQGRKISYPKDGSEGKEYSSIPITEYLLDANRHVNNGRYVELAAGLVPESWAAKRIRVEYRKQAFLGETIFPKLFRIDQRVVVKLSDKDDNPYTVVEFTLPNTEGKNAE